MRVSHLNRLVVHGEPQRTIEPSSRSMTGVIPVHGRLTQFESALERDYLILLDFSPAVASVLEQPLTITYTDPAKQQRRYTPDMLVAYHHKSPDLCEIKYRAGIKQDWAILKPKFRAGRQFAQDNGIAFRILTEVEIRTPFLRNINFLRQYRDCVPDPYISAHVLSTLALLNTTTPSDLLQAAYWLESDRVNAVTVLWQLLAKNRIYADLSQPLTMKSTIGLTRKEEQLWLHPHLSHLP